MNFDRDFDRDFYRRRLFSDGCSTKLPSMVLPVVFSAVGRGDIGDIGDILARIACAKWVRNGGIRQSMPIVSEHSPGVIKSMLAMHTINPSNNGMAGMVPCDSCCFILLRVKKPFSRNTVVPVMAVISMISMVFKMPMVLLV